MNQKTTRHKKVESARRAWYFFDASGWVLGRLAARIARVLMGKHKVEYSPHWDQGDHVVVVNTAQIKVTGKKETGKKYYRHTGYPGGIRERTLGDIREKQPNELIRLSVKRMLPKSRLGRQMIKKLYLYPAEEQGLEDQRGEFIRVNHD